MVNSVRGNWTDFNWIKLKFEKSETPVKVESGRYTAEVKHFLKILRFIEEKGGGHRMGPGWIFLTKSKNKDIHRLKDENKISEELLNKLSSRGGQPPRLYGLAKVHKQAVPVRPVLSMPGSPYDRVGTVVTEWLSTIPSSQIRCTNKQVVGKIKDVVFEDDEVIMSFDVSSLNTNVPVDEAIHEAADILYSGNISPPPVDKETFITLLELACSNADPWWILSTN